VILLEALEAMNVAVHLQNGARAGLEVEPVDVLRDDNDLGDQFLELGKRPVPSVWSLLSYQPTPVVVQTRAGLSWNPWRVASSSGL
jgi:hypothetical protein